MPIPPHILTCMLTCPHTSQLSEARSTLSQHPMMLQELSEWEEQQRSRELLNSAHINLTGRRVLVYNIQNAANWISGTVSAHNQQTKVQA